VPFNQAEIEELLQGKPASEMFNFRSPSFKGLGLDREKLGNEKLVELMLKEPRLVRRPVVRIGNEVLFGADAKRLAGILG
jgi:arsenate reductase-like glutaredoxin family protein